MTSKSLILVMLAIALSGCASTGNMADNDPVRTRVLAELQQAKADGSVPLTEAQFVYPNWATSQKAP